MDARGGRRCSVTSTRPCLGHPGSVEAEGSPPTLPRQRHSKGERPERDREDRKGKERGYDAPYEGPVGCPSSASRAPLRTWVIGLISATVCSHAWEVLDREVGTRGQGEEHSPESNEVLTPAERQDDRRADDVRDPR